MKIQCPHCKKDIEGRFASMIPKEQTFFMELTTTGEMLSAKTLGETITNTEKMLVAVAKDIGGKVSVFVRSVSVKAHKIKIEFCILDVRT